MVEQNIQTPAQAKPAASDDDKAKKEAAEAAKVDAHPAKGQFVLYLGPSNIARAVESDDFKDRRLLPGEGTLAEITPAQWASVGLRGERQLPHVWDLSNDWKLPATQFTPEQVAYLATNEGHRFALVDQDGKRVDS